MRKPDSAVSEAAVAVTETGVVESARSWLESQIPPEKPAVSADFRKFQVCSVVINCMGLGGIGKVRYVSIVLSASLPHRLLRHLLRHKRKGKHCCGPNGPHESDILHSYIFYAPLLFTFSLKEEVVWTMWTSPVFTGRFAHLVWTFVWTASGPVWTVCPTLTPRQVPQEAMETAVGHKIKSGPEQLLLWSTLGPNNVNPSGTPGFRKPCSSV